MNRQGSFSRAGTLIALVFLFLVAIGPVAATYDSIFDIPTDIVAMNRADTGDGTPEMDDTCKILEEDLGIAEPAGTEILLAETMVPAPPVLVPEAGIIGNLLDAVPGAEALAVFRGGIPKHGAYA